MAVSVPLVLLDHLIVFFILELRKLLLQQKVLAQHFILVEFCYQFSLLSVLPLLLLRLTKSEVGLLVVKRVILLLGGLVIVVSFKVVATAFF